MFLYKYIMQQKMKLHRILQERGNTSKLNSFSSFFAMDYTHNANLKVFTFTLNTDAPFVQQTHQFPAQDIKGWKFTNGNFLPPSTS